MSVFKIVLMVAFVIVCVAITAIILSQEGKSAGLGSLSGSTSESYWNKNKKHSKEGVLVRITTVLVVVFFIIAAVLNIGSF